MAVSVRPERFTMVHFDADEIRDLVERLVADVGLPADAAVIVEVDETTPLGRSVLASVDPVVLQLESGALEDPKRPRQLDPVGAADVLGRLLLAARDRRDPAFGDPPPDEELPLPHSVAWQVYCVGRLSRLGYRTQPARRRYQFRNRHGFTDAADAVFDELWAAEGLTWADLTAASDRARAALPA
ncbi:MAG TPA: hypothetical protein VK007_00130 [Acidimicrobiales bacterium]|nr:hypothetical protein [Acidimicrobiales bacterium]